IVDANTIEVDFPDGTIKQFVHVDPEWRLASIRDASGNTVALDYWTGAEITSRVPGGACPSGTTLVWDAHDCSDRHHYVCFESKLYDGKMQPMALRVSVPAIG